MDVSSLLLPVSNTPLSGIELSKRLPSGEAEITQKSIQSFLVLRELIYTLEQKKDDMLPLKETPISSFNTKSVVHLDDKKLNMKTCTMIVGSQKKRIKRYFFVETAFLIIVEPTNVPNNLAVCNVIPLQTLVIEEQNDVVSTEPNLQLTSHPTTWNGLFIFKNEEEYKNALEILSSTKKNIRETKMKQIEKLLQ